MENKSIQTQERQNVREVTTSCSALGANYFAFGIEDAVSVPNTGQGCLFTLIHGLKAKGNKDFAPICGSGLSNREVVFGGQKRLEEAIFATEELYNPNLIYVADGCVPAIIGDDNIGVVLSIRKKLKKAKIVYVDTTGFDGDLIYGFNKAAVATVNQVMEPPQERFEKTVNIMGIAYWYDSFFEGNALEISRLMNLLGLKVNCIFSYQSTRKQIEDMPKAALNVVLSDYINLEAAKLMEEKFDIPFVYAKRGAPIGLGATEEFLLDVAEKANLDLKEAKKKIDNEKRRIMKKVSIGLDFWFERITTYKVAIIADSARAVGLYRFLINELQLEPAFVAMTTIGSESRKILDEIISENKSGWRPPVLEMPDGYVIREIAKQTKPTLVLGRSPEKEWCMDNGAKYLPITHPVLDSIEIMGRTDIGFKGMRTYLHEIVNMLFK
jgi:Nitrogenase molybdenum-iron protein, alpha and beta chains